MNKQFGEDFSIHEAPSQAREEKRDVETDMNQEAQIEIEGNMYEKLADLVMQYRDSDEKKKKIILKNSEKFLSKFIQVMNDSYTFEEFINSTFYGYLDGPNDKKVMNDFYHYCIFFEDAEKNLPFINKIQKFVKEFRTAYEATLHNEIDHNFKIKVTDDEKSLREKKRLIIKYVDELFSDVVFNGQIEILGELIKKEGEKILDKITPKEINHIWYSDAIDIEECSDLEKSLIQRELKNRFHEDDIQLRVHATQEQIVTHLDKNTIGVFNVDGKLERIESATVPQATSIEEILLFQPIDGDATLEKYQSRHIHTFTHLQDLKLRFQIEEENGISFKDFTLREQVWLVAAIENSSEYLPSQKSVRASYFNEEKRRRFETFLHRYGVDGAKAFLSAEFGEEFEEVVLRIGETFDADVAKEIFKKFRVLVEAAQKETNILMAEYLKETPNVDPAKIERLLMERAQRFLENFVEGKTAASSREELLKALEETQTDLVILSAILRTTLKENPDLGFDILKDIEFGGYTGEEIDDEDKQEMIRILEKNWAPKGKNFTEFVSEALRTPLMNNDPNDIFYVLKRDNDILTFMRLEKKLEEDGSSYLYGGSFNVNPDVRGSGLGETMMKTVIDEQARTNRIRVDSEIGTDASIMYIERYKLHVVGAKTYDTPLGQFRSMILERNDAEEYPPLEDETSEKIVTLRIDPQNIEAMQNKINEYIEQGYRGTHASKSKIGERLITFQKPAIKLQEAA
ncbi:MAG: GNAT family N-acetyltransferase [Patescibacteria group bacterium]|jgi:predicted GNAT family N-acyltransferase